MINRAIATIGLTLALTTPALADIAIVWDFSTGANPAGAAIGTGTATITTGDHGEGWINNASLAGRTGFWDLGACGSISLSFTPSPALDTLEVVQFVDGGLYTGLLTISGGATLIGVLSAAPGPNTGPGPGSWQEWFYHLPCDRVPITITAPGTGAIIEQVSVVPEPGTIVAGTGALLLALLAVGLYSKQSAVIRIGG
jgi:hypothetical protein